MNTLKEYINRYGDQKHVTFEQLENGIVLMQIDHPLASATISLDGGQILAWHPKSQSHPVLWGADSAHWLKGRAIRAGVPICWPWFGAHPTETKWPSHGYARVCPWALTNISTLPSGELEISMKMLPDHEAAFLHQFEASLSTRITVGESLSIALLTENTGQHPLCLTEALHAYFVVSDVSDVQIEGLNHCEYVDLIDRNVIKTQYGSVFLTAETGRVYQNTKSDCLIRDSALNRTIRVEKSGSESTVVWNPWAETASKMDDLGPLAWKKMVCVESANAWDHTITLAAGTQHSLTVRYSVAPLAFTADSQGMTSS